MILLFFCDLSQVYSKSGCGPALDGVINHFAEIQKARPDWFKETHQKKRRPSGGNRRKRNNESGDGNEEYLDSGVGMQEPETPDLPDENRIDDLVARTSLFPFGPNNDFNPFVPPVDLKGDVRPKDTNTIYQNNNRQQRQRQNNVPLNNAAMLASPLRPPNRRRNEVSPSVNSESPTLPLSERSMGQQAASVPPSWRPQPSVHSYHPSLATSNATYSSSQPPSLPRSGNSSMRSSRGRNSSGGSRASSNHSNALMLRNDAAAPPFGNLGSFQGDSAHPSSDFGMRSLREEEEFPSIPDVISCRFFTQPDSDSDSDSDSIWDL